MSALGEFIRVVRQPCSEHAEMHSRAADGPRPAWPTRLGLWVHSLVCPPCRAFARQIHVLRAAARELGRRGFAENPTAMPDDVKSRLASTASKH